MWVTKIWRLLRRLEYIHFACPFCAVIAFKQYSVLSRKLFSCNFLDLSPKCQNQVKGEKQVKNTEHLTTLLVDVLWMSPDQIKIPNPGLKKSKPVLSLCILRHYSNNVYLCVLEGHQYACGLFTSLWTSFSVFNGSGLITATCSPTAKCFVVSCFKLHLLSIHTANHWQQSASFVMLSGKVKDDTEESV